MNATNPNGVPVDETPRLISSNKVEGTTVYSRDGDRLGTVYNFMVDKFTGRVAYVVVAAGGFLGMGGTYHPMPWEVFTYSETQGGYVINVDKTLLHGGPSFKLDHAPNFDRSYSERISSYYGVPY